MCRPLFLAHMLAYWCTFWLGVNWTHFKSCRSAYSPIEQLTNQSRVTTEHMTDGHYTFCATKLCLVATLLIIISLWIVPDWNCVYSQLKCSAIPSLSDTEHLLCGVLPCHNLHGADSSGSWLLRAHGNIIFPFHNDIIMCPWSCSVALYVL